MITSLLTSDFQGMQVAVFDTRTLLKHASIQARDRNYQDLVNAGRKLTRLACESPV